MIVWGSGNEQFVGPASTRAVSLRLSAIHLTCNSFMLPYHCAISGSWFLAALSVVWGHGNLKNILSPTPPEVNGKATGVERTDRES